MATLIVDTIRENCYCQAWLKASKSKGTNLAKETESIEDEAESPTTAMDDLIPCKE